MSDKVAQDATAAGLAAAMVLLALLITVVLPFVYAWLLMLFIGNMGLPLSYWGALPGAAILMALKTKFTTNAAKA